MAMSHTTTILDEPNGNTLALKSSPLAPSLSAEDLSEYTDADESISAPTEYFAEFLSAIMTHDYRKALKYCKLILAFEPNNITAKDFYPLILEKISYQQQESETDENSNVEDFEAANSKSDSNFSDATEASSSEAEFPSSNGSNDDCYEGRDDIEDIIENIHSGNSYSDSTTHSYSSLLLEDEDDLIQSFAKKESLQDICNGNGNGVSSFSDSESPTEPLTQRLAGIFRSSCLSSNT